MTRTLVRETWLPQSRNDVFGFFSNAANLQVLTPSWLNFQILTPLPIEMRRGTLIEYRLRLRGFPIRWKTEITVWEPPARFVDEQIRGPYRQWIHEHVFIEREQGTQMIDRVDYRVPGGPLERILHKLLIGPDLRRIFEYREKKLATGFELAAP